MIYNIFILVLTYVDNDDNDADAVLQIA